MNDEKIGPLYHGTEHTFDKFDFKSLTYIGKMTGANTGAIWFSDNKYAAKYFGPKIKKVNLWLENPLHVTNEQFVESRKGPGWWATEASKKGHDAVIIHDTVDGDTRSTVYGVFDPDTIEIINNKKSISEKIEKANKDSVVSGQKVETTPSDAQKNSGNYKKGHIRIHGLDIVIENPKGSVRSGVSKDGKEWSNKLYSDYGYIKGFKGSDKDELDIVIGEHHDSEFVYIVNQKKDGTKTFDEHKVILGTINEKEAKQTYLDNYDKNWLSRQGGSLDGTSITIGQFKDWLEKGDTKNPITMKSLKENFTKDKADPLVDPHQSQPGSGPPAFGLPPSGHMTEHDSVQEQSPVTAKRIFIIHGWDGSPESNWFPWIKNELAKKNFEVIIPEMPLPDKPNIDSWLSHLFEVVGVANEDTYFIGHSIGCQAILRFVEELPIEEKIGGAVFVAGFFKLSELETEEEKQIAKPWLEIPIDFNKVKQNIGSTIAIFSTNDPDVPLSNKDFFQKNLNSKIVIEKDMGHFADGITELPIALNSIIEIINETTKPTNDLKETIDVLEYVGDEGNPARILRDKPKDPHQLYTDSPQPPEELSENKEHIISAAANINGKTFTGQTHGETLQKAIDAGEVKEKNGRYYDKKGNNLWGSGWNDLFLTSDGKLIDRFEASRKFNVSATENMPKVNEDGAGGWGGLGIGRVKKLWKFTKPPVDKVKEIDELSAGGAGFVVGGARNYGLRPPGPGSGPNATDEMKKFDFEPHKIGEEYLIDIKRNGEILHTIKAKTREELIELGKQWVKDQIKEKNQFKKQIKTRFMQ